MATIALDLPDLAVGATRTITVDGRKVLLCRSAAGLHAVDPVCPHQDKLLEGGRLRGQSIICPHHGARFDLKSGQSLSPQLTTKSLPVYPCIVADGVITLDIP